jgi:hypothetical protein
MGKNRMGALNDAWNFIVEYIGSGSPALKQCGMVKSQLENKLQTANNFGDAMKLQVSGLKTEVDALNAEKEQLSISASDDASTISGLNARIAELQAEVAGTDTAQLPGWLDQSKVAYLPPIRVPDDVNHVVSINPTQIYSQSLYLQSRFSEYLTSRGTDYAKDFKQLSRYNKLMYAWQFVIDSITYDYKETQNIGLYAWQTHIPTLALGIGDCDEGAILFIDTCRMIGILADATFNCVGDCAFGYHSYPIAWLSTSDIAGTPVESKGPGWYIFETTLDFYPAMPDKLQGNPTYWMDNMANWRFQGTPIPDYKNSNLNGSKPGTAPGASAPMFSSEKLKKINEYWRSKPEAAAVGGSMDLPTIPDAWKRIIARAALTGLLTCASTWAASGTPATTAGVFAAVLAGAITFLTDIQGALGSTPTAKPGRLASLLKAL